MSAKLNIMVGDLSKLNELFYEDPQKCLYVFKEGWQLNIHCRTIAKTDVLSRTQSFSRVYSTRDTT